MKRLAAALWAVLTLVHVSHAASPVWKISGNSSHVFLAGTIHLLGESDYPLPGEFDRAYNQSDLLVFETDLAATRSPDFSRKMMGQMVYADDRTLKTRISAGTFKALGRFARTRGISPGDLDRFKPGLVMVFLTMAEMERLGLAGKGVDEFYFEKAGTDGLPVQFLESPTEQIRFLAGIGNGNEDEMIRYILKDVGELPGLVGTVKTAWRRGDMDALYTATLAPLNKDFPDLYKSLIVRRNMNWLPAIKKMLATPEVELILVGTAHLAGNDGLLNLLETRGFAAKNL